MIKQICLITAPFAVFAPFHSSYGILGDFTEADGYTLGSVTGPGSDANDAAWFQDFFVGPEVSEYAAGTDVTDPDAANGRWVNLFGAGTSGINGSAPGVFGTGGSDNTYIAGHFIPTTPGFDSRALAIRAAGGNIDGETQATKGATTAAWRYSFDNVDFQSTNPADTSSHIITMSFAACVEAGIFNGDDISFVDDNINMFTMGWGANGVNAVEIAVDDEQDILYKNSAGVFVDTGIDANPTSVRTEWDNFEVSINTFTDTFSLVINGITVVASETLAAELDSVTQLDISTLPDTEGGTANNGLAKTFLDSFDITVEAVPEPSAYGAICALFALTYTVTRRRRG